MSMNLAKISISNLFWFIRLMTAERILYKYLVWPMGFSLRQANLFMCKARAISRGRRAAGYWNNIQNRKSGYYLRSYPPAWQEPYAIILLLTFSPLQREPHGPNINNLAIVLSLSVLIWQMILYLFIISFRSHWTRSLTLWLFFFSRYIRFPFSTPYMKRSLVMATSRRQ